MNETPDQNTTQTLQQLVTRAQKVSSHAWMVRTFIKHAPETEDFPELMGIVRTVFDITRALETRASDPVGYFRMLGKKLGKLKAAAEQFAIDAQQASTHTNFTQAIISMRTAIEDLDTCLLQSRKFTTNNPTPAPTKRQRRLNPCPSITHHTLEASARGWFSSPPFPPGESRGESSSPAKRAALHQYAEVTLYIRRIRFHKYVCRYYACHVEGFASTGLSSE